MKSMSKRLQIVVPDAEMEEIRSLADRDRIPVREWVRRALLDAKGRQAGISPHAKLEAIREAAQHSFSTADIDQMLGQIESAYGH
jgi:hypothetical protein